MSSGILAAFPMTEDDMDVKRKGFLVALAIGLLSAPALAFGVAQTPGADSTATVPVTSATLAAAPAAAVAGPEADLAAACGAEGASLVAAEAAGTLTDVQQAALDALRPICAAAGFSLAGSPSPDAALVSAPAGTGLPPAAAPADPVYAQGYDDDGEYEDQGVSQAEYEDHEDEDESYEAED
ncbi:MAG TPA: hypothetical protein VMX37_06870 [Acidimicrobiia bacterium]|nr:hypothetical protein [Acidimicrobiia bacterium]